MLVISALGLLGVGNAWLLTATIVAIIILTVVLVRMYLNSKVDNADVSPDAGDPNPVLVAVQPRER